jgi:hypothetical protein
MPRQSLNAQFFMQSKPIPQRYPTRVKSKAPPLKSERRYPRPRKPAAPASWGREIRYILPANALDLSDDILRLEQILHLMWELNPLHLGNIMTQTQRDSCGRALRTTTAVIKGWHRTAKDRLAKEYLT